MKNDKFSISWRTRFQNKENQGFFAPLTLRQRRRGAMSSLKSGHLAYLLSASFQILFQIFFSKVFLLKPLVDKLDFNQKPGI